MESSKNNPVIRCKIKNITVQTNKTSSQKKKEVSERSEKLDPNNNKNIKQRPLIKKRGKLEHDDGFEHRTSKETSV